MKKLWYKLQSKFLTAFGNIKVFRFPFFFVYDPDSFAVTGKDIFNALDILQPGDILLRGYRHYLDGYFIPGDYSHGAIYIGDNTIIHAVAEGVSEINAIDFMECDRVCILRPAKCQKKAIQIAKKFAKDKIPYDFGFKRGTSSLYCFELAAECYPTLQIDKKKAKVFGGLLRKKEPVYLAESFFDSPDFQLVFECNPAKKTGK